MPCRARDGRADGFELACTASRADSVAGLQSRPIAIVFHRVCAFTPEPAILTRRLAVMALLRQALPVGLIPEEPDVATVRRDVVDDRCRHEQTCRRALGAHA